MSAHDGGAVLADPPCVRCGFLPGRNRTHESARKAAGAVCVLGEAERGRGYRVRHRFGRRHGELLRAARDSLEAVFRRRGTERNGRLSREVLVRDLLAYEAGRVQDQVARNLSDFRYTVAVLSF